MTRWGRLGTVIDLADDALTNWLGESLDDPINIGHPPSAAKKAAVHLHLHNLRERTEERRDDFEDIRDDDGRVVARQGAPRIFELDYLAVASGPDREQHRVLGALVQALVDHDHVPVRFVPDGIRVEARPLLLEIAQPEQMVDILAGAGVAGHAAVGLRVTVPVRPAPRTDIATPAEDFVLKAGQRAQGANDATTTSENGAHRTRQWRSKEVLESVISSSEET